MSCVWLLCYSYSDFLEYQHNTNLNSQVIVFPNASLLFLHSARDLLILLFRFSLKELKFSNEYSFNFFGYNVNYELLLLASYVLYFQTNISLIFSDSVNYKLLLLASYVLFSVSSGISELFWGMIVVLLDESWVAEKLSDFSTEVKTKTTTVDKFKLRFETVFLASMSQQ